MVFIGIILVLIGVIGFGLGAIMVGDIGFACIIGAAGAFFSGIGFLVASSKFKKLKKGQEQ